MSRLKTAKQYSRLIHLWPTDVIRPELSFASKVLTPRLTNAPTPPRNEDAEINAAYLLLENSISKRYPLQEKLLRPASSPNFYLDLERRLAAAPNQSWMSRMMEKMANMVRMK